MVLAVVPVKSLQLAKSRLSGLLTTRERRALVLAMLGDVLEALRATEQVRGTIVVSRDPEALALAVRLGAEALLDRAGDLNGALEQASAFAHTSGATSVLGLHADLALVQPAELSDLIAAGDEAEAVVLAPSRDGGTNAIYRAPAHGLPYLFGANSLLRYLQAARTAGIAARLFHAPGLELDIDRPEDLLLLAESAGDTATQRAVRDMDILDRYERQLAGYW